MAGFKNVLPVRFNSPENYKEANRPLFCFHKQHLSKHANSVLKMASIKISILVFPENKRSYEYKIVYIVEYIN